MFDFTSPYSGQTMKAAFIRDRYLRGERLYLGLWTHDEEDDYWEPWCDVTINLPNAPQTDESCAYVDTNDAPGLDKFLEENGFAKPTGRTAVSGFCTYQEFRFDLEKISEHLLKT